MPDSKKRKKQFYMNASKRSRREDVLRPGVAGFIITCNQRVKNAVAESYHLLNEYVNIKHEGKSLCHSAEEDVDLSVEDALENELQRIKNASKFECQFQNLQNKANNVIFIQTTIDDPTKLATAIYEDILGTKTRKTRYCLRFLPVISTCYAKLEEIIKHAKPIVEAVFHKAEKPFTFHIMWKTRCNSSLKREDVFLKLLECIHAIEKGHTTDYRNPEVVFNLDVIGNICCFGILRNYHKYKKYNLDQLVEVSKLNERETMKEIQNTDVDLWTVSDATKENKDDGTLQEPTNAKEDSNNVEGYYEEVKKEP